MPVLVANHSSYPRIGERPEEQGLRRAVEKWEKKEISDEGLDEVIGRVIREVISEQERGGADLVTDGQIRWHDPVSHWLKGFRGVRIRGLLRFFDTNFYFRVPRVERPLERRDSFLQKDLATAVGSSKKPVKAVLTGPVTLASLAEKGSGYGQIETLLEDLTVLMAEEISGLAEGGVGWIQIDEPIVLRRPEFFPHLSASLKKLAPKKGKSKIVLATYFSDATPFYEKMQDLPVDGLALDCIYGAGLLEKIASEGSGKALSLGLVDGRSTRLEKAEDLVKTLAPVRRTVGDKEIHLTSSCGLEYLPRGRAFEKLSLLKRLKEALS